MSHTHWRCLIVPFALAFMMLAPVLVRADEPKKPEPKLKLLLKERLATAREMVDLTARAYKGGEVSATAVHEAVMTLLDVEMDMCETDAERIAVQKKIVVEAKKYEQTIEQLVKGGQLAVRDALKVKLIRLEAEIALERLQQKLLAVQVHGGWWCDEHGVPEDSCSRCNSNVAKQCKAKGDWCDKHDRAKSQCFLCNPKLKERFAAMYRAKYGKEPPPIEEEEEVKKAANEQADKETKNEKK